MPYDAPRGRITPLPGGNPRLPFLALVALVMGSLSWCFRVLQKRGTRMTMRGIAFFSHAPLGGGGEGEGEGGEERRRKRRWGSLLACVFLLVAVACAKQALYETTLLAQALFFSALACARQVLLEMTILLALIRPLLALACARQVLLVLPMLLTLLRSLSCFEGADTPRASSWCSRQWHVQGLFSGSRCSSRWSVIFRQRLVHSWFHG